MEWLISLWIVIKVMTVTFLVTGTIIYVIYLMIENIDDRPILTMLSLLTIVTVLLTVCVHDIRKSAVRNQQPIESVTSK
jgi:hypothetical protein